MSRELEGEARRFEIRAFETFSFDAEAIFINSRGYLLGLAAVKELITEQIEDVLSNMHTA